MIAFICLFLIPVIPSAIRKGLFFKYLGILEMIVHYIKDVIVTYIISALALIYIHNEYYLLFNHIESDTRFALKYIFIELIVIAIYLSLETIIMKLCKGQETKKEVIQRPPHHR